MIRDRARGGDIPPTAAALGAAGLIPFVAGAVLVWTMPNVSGIPAGRVLIVYGAVIASFLGGMLWGLAAAALAHDPDDARAARLLPATVVPSLVAWVLVFMPQPLALWGLSATFLATLLVDRWARRIGVAPLWWMRLRLRLTAIVVTSLLAAVGAGYGR